MFNRLRRCCSDILTLIVGWVPVFFQIIYGLVKMSRLSKPVVTVFGGSRFDQNSEYAKIAKDLASTLAKHDISVITGGGPGIMEAANCGVDLNGGDRAQTMGVMVSDLDSEGFNKCSGVQIKIKYFFARKWLLTRYSSGFVVFPGGYGTLDELMEILTLIKTKKIKKVPIILFGSSYWQPMVDWLEGEPVKFGAITKSEIKLIVVSDDQKKVIDILCDSCTKRGD